MADGRFEIRDILGAGAFAVVCTALDRPAGQVVALKVLRTSVRGDPSAVARLRDEGRILLRLQHPNIVGGIELLEYDSHPVVLLERVDGISLEWLLQKEMPIGVANALRIAAEVASALDFAWNAPDRDGEPMRIVHRDLKPNNVLVDREGHVKVVDFGIAKGAFSGRKAKSLFVVQGTPGFDAPERVLGQAEGPEVDVYGLGALLLTLITGKAPLISKRVEIRQAELTQHLDRLPNADAGEARIRLVIERMLSATARDRPAMPELARELLELSAGADLRALVQQQPPQTEGSDPHEHECWDEVAFLEHAVPTDPRALSRADVEAWVARFVLEERWEERLVELESVLGRAESFAPEALVAVLQRSHVPWYTPWVSRSRTSEIEAALMVLCDRADAAVVQQARRLVDHADARVMAAARFLLAQAG